MRLNRTPNPLNRDARNKENENWDTIQQKFNNVVEEVSDAAFQKVIDGSKIDWEQMVDKVSDLPSNVETGETRGVKEDNKIYRFNGTDWIPIAEINLNPIAEVDQRLTTQLAQTNEELSEFRGFGKNRAIFTIHSDDGRLGDYTVLLPILKEYGIPASIAIPPDNIGLNDYMTWGQIDELVNQHGWSVMSHTLNETQLPDVSLEEVDRQLRESKRKIEAKGYRCDHFVYPNGRFDDSHVEIAKKYYKSSGTVDYDGFNEYPVKSHYLRRSYLHPGENYVQSVKNELDILAARGGWFILFTHGQNLTGAYGATLQSYLREIIEYVQSLNIEVLNHDEAWEEIGNVIDLGLYGSDSSKNKETTFVLAKNGKFLVNNLKDVDYIKTYSSVKYGGETLVATKGATEYEAGKITVEQVSSNGAPNFPESKPGTLITNRFITFGGYPYQEYRILNSSKVYHRFWDGSAWTTWQLQTINLLGANDIGVSTSPSTLGKGITHTQITNNKALEYPDGRAGTLITYNLIEFAGYPWQEYHVLNLNRVWRRFWRGSVSGWSEWEVVQGAEERIIPVAASSSRYDVALELPQKDSNYMAIITPAWNADSVWVENITETSFRVSWTNAPTAESKFAYRIVR